MTREFEDWTVEALRDYEQDLYDREVLYGDGTWSERERVLDELSFRDVLQ